MPEVSNVRFNALTRPHFYVGKAWYQRDIYIPQEWTNKRIHLFLERAHWITEVWINQHKIGSQDSLSTPHEYDLSQFLTPEYSSFNYICQ
ncbi:sugar-binding domain-containing protein [Paraglaciecola aquimarina]|uniref:sugar-binding domain-containing protein n=1 Tax=Paraglaciecola aquimarina TaxID=1235557 RepID=UPI003D18589A